MEKNIKLLMLGLLLSACSYWPDDNPIEELAEDYIEEKTGVDIDFTGESEEEEAPSFSWDDVTPFSF